ncbi:MAG: MSHA biogenesis protein MshK [Janthinobacterium sp.]
MDGPVKRALAWLGLSCLTMFAQAQSVDDPTRPPAALAAPVSVSAVPATPSQPQLQSVLISSKPGGRRVAVINGQVVRPGGRVGEAVVVEIQETAVVLRKGKSLHTYKLYPSSKTERK